MHKKKGELDSSLVINGEAALDQQDPREPGFLWDFWAV